MSVPRPSKPKEQGQYFNEHPSAPSRRRQVPLLLPDVSLELTTDRGVFARDGVDPGTKLLLLDGPEPTDGDRHLCDVGAGYGPISLTLARRNPEATIWAIEVNSRARALCSENAAAAGLDNVRVVAPDEVPNDVIFDRVWSNPPIRVGKAELHGLLELWLSRLAPNRGTGHLVVQKHLGSDSLARWLNDNGWTTTRRASRGGYRLLDVASHSSTDPSS